VQVRGDSSAHHEATEIIFWFKTANFKVVNFPHKFRIANAETVTQAADKAITPF
jgi:hypothetical protein